MSFNKLLARLQQTLPRANLIATSLPECPQVQLYLFDPAVMEGPLSHDEAQAVVAEPAYWSFCWASGQVLAAYLLEHAEWVRGKTVLDFGSGSGVVAIAAALAGAARVIACDIDPAALEAIQANMALNGVTLEICEDFFSLNCEVDLLVAADVLYDPENLPFLGRFRQTAKQVVLADSRIRHLPDDRYQKVTQVECRTCPDLNEFEEFNLVRIYEVN
ncbi:MAG: methyltransferase [Hahellaceae bacterium]|nr:methyltransferase [Hahellaceae bacterium]MCP5170532.1 methyltransferase [Hahellaceae bacterium]